MIRLVPDQTGLIERGNEVAFTFDGKPVLGHQGETVAAALFRARVLELRKAPNGGGSRGAFCCMGICQECSVRVNKKVVESCRLKVRSGLVVERLS